MSGPGRRLRVPSEVAALLRALHPHIKRKVKAALKAILEDPDSGKALKDELDGLRSFRVGGFRVVYRVTRRQGAIEVVAVGPRKEIYTETLRLLKKGR